MNIAGISFCDISTGEFYTYEVPADQISQQIESISPSEILVQKKDKDYFTKLIQKINPTIRITKIDDWVFNFEYAKEMLVMQFKTVNFERFWD